MVVPTNLAEITEIFRNAGQPVTLFGERPEDRTERLREWHDDDMLLHGLLQPDGAGWSPTCST